MNLLAVHEALVELDREMRNGQYAMGWGLLRVLGDVT